MRTRGKKRGTDSPLLTAALSSPDVPPFDISLSADIDEMHGGTGGAGAVPNADSKSKGKGKIKDLLSDLNKD